jgi:hypothetical protein
MTTTAATRGARRPSRFERLADWSYGHGRRALAVWVVILVGIAAASSAIGDADQNDNSLPGTESGREA